MSKHEVSVEVMVKVSAYDTEGEPHHVTRMIDFRSIVQQEGNVVKDEVESAVAQLIEEMEA